VVLPKENRKDLRDVPRRVLASLRLVLVDHVDDVLREALVVTDPDKLFGPTHGVVEYRNGELFSEGGPGSPQPASERPATAPPTIPGGPPVSGPPDGRPAAE